MIGQRVLVWAGDVLEDGTVEEVQGNNLRVKLWASGEQVWHAIGDVVFPGDYEPTKAED